MSWEFIATDINRTPVGVNHGWTSRFSRGGFGSKVISKLWMLERGDLMMGNDVDFDTLLKKKVALVLGIYRGLGHSHVPPVKQ